jgi:hypothetical protein
MKTLEAAHNLVEVGLGQWILGLPQLLLCVENFHSLLRQELTNNMRHLFHRDHDLCHVDFCLHVLQQQGGSTVGRVMALVVASITSYFSIVGIWGRSFIASGFLVLPSFIVPAVGTCVWQFSARLREAVGAVFFFTTISIENSLRSSCSRG